MDSGTTCSSACERVGGYRRLLPRSPVRVHECGPIWSRHFRAERLLPARLHHGPQSHQVIALAATGQLGMAAAGQIRLAVVISGALEITRRHAPT